MNRTLQPAPAVPKVRFRQMESHPSVDARGNVDGQVASPQMVAVVRVHVYCFALNLVLVLAELPSAVKHAAPLAIE